VDQLAVAPKDEIDLLAVWHLMWRYRLVLLVSGLVFGGIAYYIAHQLPPTFKAEVTITEVHENSALGAGALSSQLSGLASLAGVNLGAASGAERESRAVLKSRHLVEEFIRRNNLIPVLMHKSKKPPTLWTAVNHFQGEVLGIREDIRQGTIIISIEWTDAKTAADWANQFIALANEQIRTHALEQSKRNIAYLNEQVAKTNVVELQRVMFNLIEGETKTAMLANGRIEYAFRIVDPAVAPELRSGPHRTLIAAVGFLLGLMAGAIFAFIHNGRRQARARSNDT